MRRTITTVLLLASTSGALARGHQVHTSAAHSGHSKREHVTQVQAPPPAPAETCMDQIRDSEKAAGVPSQLMRSIGLVESGRADPASGKFTPWAWTINVAGVGHVFPTKEAAVESAMIYQALGVKSFDVGCMQINMLAHANAFSSLEEAFDPVANTRYAAQFLLNLKGRTGTWDQATAAYHSMTPDLGEGYRRKVMALWPLAPEYAGPNSMVATTSADADLAPPATAEIPVDYSLYTPVFAATLKQQAEQRKPLPVQPTMAKIALAAPVKVEHAADTKAASSGLVWLKSPGDPRDVNEARKAITQLAEAHSTKTTKHRVRVAFR